MRLCFQALEEHLRSIEKNREALGAILFCFVLFCFVYLFILFYYFFCFCFFCFCLFVFIYFSFFFFVVVFFFFFRRCVDASLLPSFLYWQNIVMEGLIIMHLEVEIPTGELIRRNIVFFRIGVKIGCIRRTPNLNRTETNQNIILFFPPSQIPLSISLLVQLIWNDQEWDFCVPSGGWAPAMICCTNSPSRNLETTCDKNQNQSIRRGSWKCFDWLRDSFLLNLIDVYLISLRVF